MCIRDRLDATYTKIAFNGATEWVKFAAGKEKAAAFLETHRYAATLGGTLEFTKMEGVTLNRKDKVAYIAMSRIEKSMADTSGDIQVGKITAGATYEPVSYTHLDVYKRQVMRLAMRRCTLLAL